MNREDAGIGPHLDAFIRDRRPETRAWSAHLGASASVRFSWPPRAVRPEITVGPDLNTLTLFANRPAFATDFSLASGDYESICCPQCRVD